ncbi:hypothetical protein [Cupriavidus necator]|uniref:hypothetical protein n=1 Tax=Cupriavidus necator TaxID=106590 RepID=UPI000F4F9904|nr:hypothetical protein [Cupriavidus necator]
MSPIITGGARPASHRLRTFLLDVLVFGLDSGAKTAMTLALKQCQKLWSQPITSMGNQGMQGEEWQHDGPPMDQVFVIRSMSI